MNHLPESSSAADTSAAAVRGNSLREHILLLPDGYIGSVAKRTQKLWVYDEGGFMRQRMVTYVPGLHKIFDEILVHAADSKLRNPTMDTLRVEVDAAKCRISVYTNGDSIPIEVVHGEEGVYVPEMTFGHLGSCHYDAEVVAGRRNGYGVKLANIFSTEFIVETADGRRQMKYKQVFSENMGKKSKPQITEYRKGVNWTMITFKPDLAKFNMTHLEDDVVVLMRKRVFDMAGILGISVQVVFNGQMMPRLKGFSQYVHQYLRPIFRDTGEELPWIYEKVNDQLEVCMSLSDGRFQQVSFVNKTATIAGGTHVDYVSNRIATHVASVMNELVGYKIEESDVKRYLWVFINILIENPTFDSPTNEALTTPQECFGSECELSGLFLEKVLRSRLMSQVLAWRRNNDRKKTSGRHSFRKGGVGVTVDEA